MRFKTYQRGDIVLLNFDPSLGHEQKGFRPALVWTNNESQRVSGFMSVFPITSHDKGYPLHVRIDDNSVQTTGVIMVEQITTIDLMARNVRFAEHVPEVIMKQVGEIFNEMTT